MNSTAARAEGVTKVYGWGDTRVTALDDISVAFARGEFTAVMGPSGSGKSTLMHCMAGLDSVTEGSVFIGDQDLSTLSDRRLTKLRRERIGFIFQAYNLVPTLSATENITLPLDLAGTKVDQSWFDSVVETLGVADRLKHRPSELSGGQQQRVAAARAMVSRPDLIFADEDLPVGDGVQAGHAVHERRLARSGRPHDGGQLAGVEGHVHAVEGTDLGVAGSVDLGGAACVRGDSSVGGGGFRHTELQTGDCSLGTDNGNRLDAGTNRPYG